MESTRILVTLLSLQVDRGADEELAINHPTYKGLPRSDVYMA